MKLLSKSWVSKRRWPSGLCFHSSGQPIAGRASVVVLSLISGLEGAADVKRIHWFWKSRIVPVTLGGSLSVIFAAVKQLL